MYGIAEKMELMRISLFMTHYLMEIGQDIQQYHQMRVIHMVLLFMVFAVAKCILQELLK